MKYLILFAIKTNRLDTCNAKKKKKVVWVKLSFESMFRQCRGRCIKSTFTDDINCDIEHKKNPGEHWTL